MRPSHPLWRRPAPQQGRCRCLPRRAMAAANISQADVHDYRSRLVNVSFKVEYKCPYGQSLTLVGDTAPLGSWSSKRGQRMHWSRGDVWTCNVMLPAGSEIECKYVIVDDQGRAQRWQEGSNMVVTIPDTHQGLPLQRYDVGVSWCKNHVNYRCVAAQPNNAAQAAAVFMENLKSTCATAVPSAAAALAGELAPPMMAWALSKGASTTAGFNPTPLVHHVAEAQATMLHLPSASAVQCSAVNVPASPAQQPPSTQSLRKQVAVNEPLSQVETGAGDGSKVATLFQAAANAVCKAHTGPAGSRPSEAIGATASSVGMLSSFQISSASSDGEPTMSIVLPPRSKSPPVKISLSSSFSKLLDMPALSRTGGSNSSSTSTGAVIGTAVMGKTTGSSIQSHAIDPVVASSTHTAHIGGGAPQPPVATNSIDKPAVSPLLATANTVSGSRNSGNSRQSSSTAASASPTWGMEYDIYATAYGLSYMNTSFDLESYAVYDQTGPAPSSSPSSSLSSMSSGHLYHGSTHDLLSANQSRGADPLESAVQAALSSSPDSKTAPTANFFPSTLLGATAASTSLALSAATVSSLADSASAVVATPFVVPTNAAASHPADAVVSAPVDVYRQVSRSSTSISDWAGRTLIEMSCGHSLIDEDSDEDETADDEAVVTQALATPAAPADMAALLTQLGTALGRSVRLRYDGIDATAQDLLELDRKIALAASKLYRQRDTMLTGWLRKETRRQLATVAAATVSRPPMPASNTVTSL
ncbi:hypothetical protein Vafri_19157 [Volvox africanus]|uniref:CBM20 domain-containing protein n=1 Tax=Volvox africanus TaxID=51714 RepID=A0A8J4FBV0_9CHLO|nr:hypothetical protein Vafri_19157 [Volvox africanus]